ncbi:Acyl-CoA dehydrogenase/oxidase N-terminal protein [Dioscorea alata]|uniref:Acyl-CoA dehydrogenase/oxidase N-terminal protein n=1 Tax=Dioscorea alata TaxID=55571 RepID=A0ACB7VRK9_DIOAL|nr:Acyl-CoA dehydrogenase/oxidase N-terminal protein [Dioscorea alata]
MVVAKLKQAKGSETRADRDKPYPSYHDLVPYPKGYNVPKFKQFTGISNPDQHLGHFVMACGDTSTKPSLLLRHFSTSLAGVAFKWYLKDAFRVRFGGISDKITIVDLTATRQYKDEKVVNYIMRWRNLSIKFEQPLDQPQAVGLLLENIDSWMSPFLSTSGITTFQDLISQAKKLERTNLRNDRDKSKRIEGVKDTATTFNIEKEKGVTESHKPKQAKAPGLGIAANESRPLHCLKDRMNKKYSFRRDKGSLGNALKNLLKVPTIKHSKKKNKNRKQKCEQSKRKKFIIKEYIETLDEYEQKERVLITLRYYFLKEVEELLGELAEEIDKNDEDVQVEIYRVISRGEYPLYNPEYDDNDDYDSFSEPEESYDRYGRLYISKKQRKKIAFRKRVKKMNAKLLEPYQQIKPKGPYYTLKTPKYKVLRKAIPAKDIPAFILRVT